MVGVFEIIFVAFSDTSWAKLQKIRKIKSFLTSKCRINIKYFFQCRGSSNFQFLLALAIGISMEMPSSCLFLKKLHRWISMIDRGTFRITKSWPPHIRLHHTPLVYLCLPEWLLTICAKQYVRKILHSLTTPCDNWFLYLRQHCLLSSVRKNAFYLLLYL